MKFSVVFLSAFAIASCHGQQSPTAWGRDQRSRSVSQEHSNDVLVNTDRLTSSLENKILQVVRSEIESMLLKFNRLEQTNARFENQYRSDIAELKQLLEALRDNSRGDDLDLSVFEQLPATKKDDLIERFDTLSLGVNAIRGTVGKLERNFMNLRRNLKPTNEFRHHQPQYAFIQGREEAQSGELSVCTANDPNTESGLRIIRKNFYARCEMDDDDEAGGWLVIQNRFDGNTEFFRSWNEYKEGFGNIAGEFWMGLDKIHELTSSRLYKLLIVMEAFDGTTKSATYSAFGISDESSFFSINLLGKYSGDAGDSLTYHVGMRFSTFDQDNDNWADGNCAKSHFGGWWYKSCDEANLNGRYFENGEVTHSERFKGMYWKKFNSTSDDGEIFVPLKSVKMMIRPIDV